MNKEFVLEDKIYKSYEPERHIRVKDIKYFLQLLKDDFNIGKKRFTREEIYLLLEKRAGKSLVNRQNTNNRHWDDCTWTADDVKKQEEKNERK